MDGGRVQLVEVLDGEEMLSLSRIACEERIDAPCNVAPRVLYDKY